MTHTYRTPLHFYEGIIFYLDRPKNLVRIWQQIDLLTQLMGRDVDIRDQITPCPVPQNILDQS